VSGGRFGRLGRRDRSHSTELPDDGFVLPGEISSFEAQIAGGTRGEKEGLDAILADLLDAAAPPPEGSSTSEAQPDVTTALEAALETQPDATTMLEAALRAASDGSVDAPTVFEDAQRRSFLRTRNHAVSDDDDGANGDGEDGGAARAGASDALPTSQRRVKIVDTRAGRANRYGAFAEVFDHASEDVSEDVSGTPGTPGPLETLDAGPLSEALDDGGTAPPPHRLPEVYGQGEDDSPYFDREGAGAGAGEGADALADVNAGEDAFPVRVIIEPPPKRPVWPLFITAMVVFIVFTGGLTYFNRTLLANQLESQAAYQQEADNLLHESIALIQEADLVVIPLDRATDSQVTEEGIPQLEALLDQHESTLGTLDSAIEKATRAQEMFADEEFKALAQYARDAASYRKEMLDKSCQITTYDIAAMRAALAVGRAWDLIVEADTNMRDAAEAGQIGTIDAISTSRDYNRDAVDKLTQANDLLTEATTAFPDADLSLVSNYVVAKKASAELALASDEAYLEGDYITGNTMNNEFYAKDAEVVELAAAIPGDPLSLIVSVYDSLTAQLHEDYRLLHSQAADVDVYLRDYLGVAIQ
jgi:hypothetical protein